VLVTYLDGLPVHRQSPIQVVKPDSDPTKIGKIWNINFVKN